MSYFDETSGIVACETEFGRWWQTVDEVVIQVDLPEATRAKEISCTVLPSRMKVSVKQKTILEVTIFFLYFTLFLYIFQICVGI